MRRALTSESGLLTCQQSKSSGYGEYRFEIPFVLLNIPKRPAELLNMTKIGLQAYVDLPVQADDEQTQALQFCECILVKTHGC